MSYAKTGAFDKHISLIIRRSVRYVISYQKSLNTHAQTENREQTQRKN